jgi:hypothetical protein
MLPHGACLARGMAGPGRGRMAAGARARHGPGRRHSPLLPAWARYSRDPARRPTGTGPCPAARPKPVGPGTGPGLAVCGGHCPDRRAMSRLPGHGMQAQAQVQVQVQGQVQAQVLGQVQVQQAGRCHRTIHLKSAASFYKEYFIRSNSREHSYTSYCRTCTEPFSQGI